MNTNEMSEQEKFLKLTSEAFELIGARLGKIEKSDLTERERFRAVYETLRMLECILGYLLRTFLAAYRRG